MEQRKANPPQPENSGVERRTYTVEMRVANEGEGDTRRTVTGYAPRFNSRSEILGWGDNRFVEYFEPGAFRSAIPNSDPRALRDHIPNLILARKSANTLSLHEDANGLAFRFELPDTTYANDLAVSMERGDVRETSFAFTLKPESDIWKRGGDGIWERRIPADAVDKIYDISVVTYPAYPESEAQLNANENLSVAFRSLEAAKAQETPEPPAPKPETIEPNHRRRILEAIERAAK